MEQINEQDLATLKRDIALSQSRTASIGCLQKAITDISNTVVTIVFEEVQKGGGLFQWFRIVALGTKVYGEVRRITKEYKTCNANG
jgi:hypothetical protein